MWKCKICGGEIEEIVNKTVSTSYKLLKNKKHKKRVEVAAEEIGVQYCCTKCAFCSNVGVELEEVAEWEEE